MLSSDMDNIHVLPATDVDLRARLLDWTQLVLADNSPEKVFICPDFGQPGWAPFCFLNGNPVFKAFDGFQAFIQSAVVSLHDFLQQTLGLEYAYGASIIVFTVFVRAALFPINYKQLVSAEMTKSLSPKIQEIKEKYAGNKDLQNQMTVLLYQEANINPLAGCLPALLQIPVFIALYRSFFNLASQGNTLSEPFLWLPNLDGPVFGVRNSDWLFKTSDWHDFTPPLGWPDTLAYLTIPLLLYLAQTISLQILTPPSDDPTIQRTQQILRYLPLLIAYFSLSVPSGLGVYWITNNVLSTVSTAGIKAYLKANPQSVGANIDLDLLAGNQTSVYMIPAWGYSSEAQMIEEAKLNYRPKRVSRIPVDF